MSLHVSHHFIISCSPDKDWLPFYQPRVQRAEQSFSEKPCWVHDPLLPTHSGQIQLLGCQHNSERASVVEPLVLFLVNRQEGVGRVKRRKKDDGNWFAFDSVFSATSLTHTHTQTADYRVTAPANTVHAVPVKSRGCVVLSSSPQQLEHIQMLHQDRGGVIFPHKDTINCKGCGHITVPSFYFFVLLNLYLMSCYLPTIFLSLTLY